MRRHDGTSIQGQLPGGAFDASVALSSLRAFHRAPDWQSRNSTSPGLSIVDEYQFLLVNHLDVATLRRAAQLSEESGHPLPHVLVSHGWMSERDYARALAVYFGVDMAEQHDLHVRPDHIATAHVVALDAHADGKSFVAVNALAIQPRHLDRLLAAHAKDRQKLLIATVEQVDRIQLRPITPHMMHHAILGLANRDPSLSALQTIARWQLYSLWVIGILATAAAFVFPNETVRVALLLTSLPILCLGLIRLLGLWTLLSSRTPSTPAALSRIPDERLPFYSVMVALYQEAEVLPRLVRSLSKLDYPPMRLEILLVVEEVDAETQAAIRAIDLPGNFKTIIVPQSQPRTKPKALNFALGLARGRYAVVYDAEDRPEPDQLRKALAKFATSPRDLACVQARLNTYNPSASFLSRQFTIEYTVLFDTLLPALERLRLPLPLGGTSNHFDIEALRRVGAWDPYNVTEDADLGIRLARFGYRTGMIDATTWEEAPEQFRTWLPQRTRWLKGWMQTYLVHLRQPLVSWRQLGPFGFIGTQVLMAGILASVMVHPWMYVLLGIDYWLSSPKGHDSEPLMAETAASIFMLFNIALGVLSTIVVAAYAVWRRGWHRLAFSALLMPIYWLLISLAGYRALVQLVRKPYLWEKTPHGAPKASPRK